MFIIPAKSSPISIDTNSEINVLLIFDYPFGTEYFFTREVLEDRFSWKITTTSLFKTISPCSESYPSIEVDYTINELPSIDTFDIILQRIILLIFIYFIIHMFSSVMINYLKKKKRLIKTLNNSQKAF